MINEAAGKIHAGLMVIEIFDLVGRERLELSTNGLRVHCSTN
jgi:hypothetical protein